MVQNRQFIWDPIYIYINIFINSFITSLGTYTGLFISPSGTSELDCATTKKDRAERSISIGRESLSFILSLYFKHNGMSSTKIYF